jgi:hypothetical protein
MRIPGHVSFRCVCSASLLLVLPAIAFAGGANAPASPHPKPDRQIKVWTNEDVEALGPRFEPARETVQVTPRGAAAVTLKAVSAPLPPEQDPRWYAQQLAPLESELESVSNEASELRRFRATATGLPTGLNLVAPCEGVGTDNLIAQLEARRQELLDQMDALADTARANGMPPGILVEGRGLVSTETPLTLQQQEKALVERYQSLSDQLADTRQTIVAMHEDVASQGATLLQPRAGWGGNMTTNLLEGLYAQQSAFESEISAAEDQMRQAGLSVP